MRHFSWSLNYCNCADGHRRGLILLPCSQVFHEPFRTPSSEQDGNSSTCCSQGRRYLEVRVESSAAGASETYHLILVYDDSQSIQRIADPRKGSYWIVNQILSKGLHNVDQECLTFTTTLMDKLEQVWHSEKKGDPTDME